MNTIIKQVTVYEVNGRRFDTEEDAQQYLNKQTIEEFLLEADDMFPSNLNFNANEIAEYLIKCKERLIHLLSFIK